MARLVVVWAVLTLIACGCGGSSDSAGVDPSVVSTAAAPADTALDPTTSETSTTEAAAPESTAPAESTEPPETAMLPVAGWERVSNDTDLWANEIIAVSGELYAIGSAQDPASQRSGVWRSTNGISWTDSLVFTNSRTGLRVDPGDIATIDNAIVMVARRTDGPPWPEATRRELVAFASTDSGVSWSETIIGKWDGPNFRDWPVAATFARGDPRVVFAVEGGSDAERTAITGTLIWIKTGDEWTYVDPADSGLAQAWVWAMAATDDGFVALADTRVQLEGFEDCQTQALWHSPDAKTWNKVWQNPTDCEWFSTGYMFAIDGDLYAMNENDVFSCTAGEDGSLDCPPVRLFRITDDAIEDAETEPVAFTEMFLSDVLVNEGQFIAIGRTFDERDARIWLSADALTWIPADIPSEQLADVFPFQAAATDDTVIALATEIVPAVGPTNFHTWLTTTGDQQP
jgi:hypothetical protein